MEIISSVQQRTMRQCNNSHRRSSSSRRQTSALIPLLVALIMHNTHRWSGGGGGQLSSAYCSAAEALATPFLHRRSFLLNARGGSVQHPTHSSYQHQQQQHTTTTTLHSNRKKKGDTEESTVVSSSPLLSSQQQQQQQQRSLVFTHLESSEEALITRFIAETELPTDIGQFRLRAYRICDSVPKGLLGEFVGKEPCVIYSKKHPPGRLGTSKQNQKNVSVRIHDQCFTSEVFRSQRCDCKEQLKMSLQYIEEHGGAIIYLQQEGRGIGIANKVAAYALQDAGMDTVDANIHLGFPEDCRQYGVVPSILEDIGIDSIRLMTNNPLKVERVRNLGVIVEETMPMVVKQANKYNRRYLETKQTRMNHTNFGGMLSLGTDNLDVTVTQVLSSVMEQPKPIIQNTNNGATATTSTSTTSSSTTSSLNTEDIQSGVSAGADGYCFGRKSVEDAIAAMARGEMVVVVDDEDRENEGDFIMAADLITPETMATMIRYTSGVICVGMEGDRMDELNLPPMLINNEDPKGTAFSVSVDATKEHGITTGISATDRAKTIRLLSNTECTAVDFHRPGHIFPLRAKPNGVLSRDGHTEASVDLSRLAGCNPVGVLCEIVSEENPVEMARLPELKRFCKRYGYVMTSIVDIAQYRRDTGL